jgi:hypothetical protein
VKTTRTKVKMRMAKMRKTAAAAHLLHDPVFLERKSRNSSKALIDFCRVRWRPLMQMVTG